MKPPAFIQIDLDGIWAIRRCYGLTEDDFFEHDPVYEEGIPCLLDLLSRKGIPATIFVVGRDAGMERKAARIFSILANGHEIGNHSYDHTLGLSLLQDEEIRANIDRAQKTLTGVMEKQNWGKENYPVGFRAPGYNAHPRVLKTVASLGFRYDSSLFPTWWGFVMRLIDFYISGHFHEAKRQYGPFAGGLKPLRPHPVKEGAGLYELPVSVSPSLRLPFHFGIILERGFDYYRRCVQGYISRGMPLLYLFHGVDFVDTQGIPLTPTMRGSGFFRHSIKMKLKLAEQILDHISARFSIMRARDFISALGR